MKEVARLVEGLEVQKVSVAKTVLDSAWIAGREVMDLTGAHYDQ